MRSGVALLITLFFVALLGVLVMKNQEITEQAFARAEGSRFLVQNSVMMEDALAILAQTSTYVTDADTFDVFLGFSGFSISDQPSEIELELTFERASGTYNINKIMDENSTADQKTYDLFHDLLLYEGLTDPAFFLALLLDTIDEDTNERTYGSEIAENRPFRQGAIVSWTHFEQIKRYYREQRNDTQVDKIPWKSYINFHEESMDFNYVQPKLLDLMLPDVSIDSMIHTTRYDSFDDIDFMTSDDIALAKSFGMNLFEPVVRCNLIFTQFGYNSHAQFTYNLKKRRVYDFDIQI